MQDLMYDEHRGEVFGSRIKRLLDRRRARGNGERNI